MWTDLIVRHVNKASRLWAVVRPRRTVKGQNKSTPTYVNGGFEGVTQSYGKLAIFCCITGAWRR